MKKTTVPQIIKQTFDDIVAIKIQGATNIAIAVIETIQQWTKEQKNKDKQSWTSLQDQALKYAFLLANARPNEPLASNGVKYIDHMLKKKYADVKEISAGIKAWSTLAHEYLDLVKQAKKDVVQNGLAYNPLSNMQVIYTHCHSTSAENLIIGLNKKKTLEVISSETRPLYQGRITATNLNKAGVKVHSIIDDAGPFFIKDDRWLPVNAVFLGADEIDVEGHTLNKIGSYGLALSAYVANKPVYIITPALKLNLSTIYKQSEIEMRDGKEIWADAPSGINVINPAFDLIDNRFINGFVTELGVLTPAELENAVRKRYTWMY